MAIMQTLWSTQLMAELDVIDRETTDLTSGLTVEQLNWQPGPGVWSIGQCLEHLRLANEVYLPAISAALVNAQAFAVQEITLGWFARWFIRTYIEPSPATKRGSAPRKSVPGSQIPLSVIDRFLSTNQQARKLIRLAEPCNVNRIRFVNPFVPVIRFTVGTGLRITCSHGRRHVLQAQRVKHSPDFPR